MTPIAQPPAFSSRSIAGVRSACERVRARARNRCHLPNDSLYRVRIAGGSPQAGIRLRDSPSDRAGTQEAQTDGDHAGRPCKPVKPGLQRLNRDEDDRYPSPPRFLNADGRRSQEATISAPPASSSRILASSSATSRSACSNSTLASFRWWSL
jgi:hypothetical protein